VNRQQARHLAVVRQQTGYRSEDLITVDDAVLAMRSLIRAGTSHADALITVVAALDGLGRKRVLETLAVQLVGW